MKDVSGCIECILLVLITPIMIIGLIIGIVWVALHAGFETRRKVFGK